MAPPTRRPQRRARAAIALLALVATATAVTAGSTSTTSRPSSEEVIAAGPLPTSGTVHDDRSTEPQPDLPHGADIERQPVTTLPPPTVAPTPATAPPVIAPPPTPTTTTTAAPPPPEPGPTSPPPVEAPPAVAAAPEGSVPCPLRADAEPCWARHTGVPGWTEAQIVAGQSPLEHVTGDVTVTEDGAVIDGAWIDGCVAVKANNVTIRNTLVRTQRSCFGGNGQAAGSAINVGNAEARSPGVATGLLIQDSEVDAMNATYDFAGIGAHGYTCVRCNVHGGVKNLWATEDVTIRESYIHHPSTGNGTIHSESVNSDSGSRITIDHSFINARGTDYVTAAVAFLASWGPGNDLTINNSYLEGNRGADLATAPVNHGIRITGNAFSADNGYSGTTFVYGFNPSNPGMAWSGNYIPETGAELAMPRSP